VPKATV